MMLIFDPDIGSGSVTMLDNSVRLNFASSDFPTMVGPLFAYQIEVQMEAFPRKTKRPEPLKRDEDYARQS